jgi:hypothetical protein
MFAQPKQYFRKLAAYILMLSLLTANCGQLFVYAGFQLNQKYIAAELCVNKNRPELHCNGKCYLMSKLRQAEQKERAREIENQRPVLQPALLVDRLSLQAPMFTIAKAAHPELRFNFPTRSSAIFQPPQV